MAVWLVVVSLVAVGGAGAVSFVAQRSADRAAHRAVQEALEVALRMVETRPTQPDPVILPAPDLRPYLQDLARMGQGMAREIAQGISLVVQGPPTQPPGTEAPGEPTEEEKEPVEFPAWEQDDTWGIFDPAEVGGEWSAHTVPVPGPEFSGNGFGSGGIHLPDNEGL